MHVARARAAINLLYPLIQPFRAFCSALYGLNGYNNVTGSHVHSGSEEYVTNACGTGSEIEMLSVPHPGGCAGDSGSLLVALPGGSLRRGRRRGPPPPSPSVTPEPTVEKRKIVSIYTYIYTYIFIPPYADQSRRSESSTLQ